jgi:hypothetical protein
MLGAEVRADESDDWPALRRSLECSMVAHSWQSVRFAFPRRAASPARFGLEREACQRLPLGRRHRLASGRILCVPVVIARHIVLIIRFREPAHRIGPRWR